MLIPFLFGTLHVSELCFYHFRKTFLKYRVYVGVLEIKIELNRIDKELKKVDSNIYITN